MKYRILILVLFLIQTNLLAQKKIYKPDYNQIEKRCKKLNSNFYYDSLKQRFLRGDVTFTQEEKQHLYYGYQFQTNYSPNGNSDYSDSLSKLLNINKLTEEQYKLGIKFCDSILFNNPFNLSTIRSQTNLYKLIGDLKNKEISTIKLYHLIDAIFATGDGMTDSTAYYVIEVSHEYFLINALGLKSGGMQSLIGTVDYLELAENDQKIKGLYFDVSASLNRMSKIFSDDDIDSFLKDVEPEIEKKKEK